MFLKNSEKNQEMSIIKTLSGGWSIFVHLKYRTYAKSQHWIIIPRRFPSVHQPCHSTIAFQASSMMPSKVSIFTNLKAHVSFFQDKKMPLTRFLPKKRRSPTVSYAKPKIKNTWKTSNPSEKILDVCLLCHVCFFFFGKKHQGCPYVLPNLDLLPILKALRF